MSKTTASTARDARSRSARVVHLQAAARVPATTPTTAGPPLRRSTPQVRASSCLARARAAQHGADKTPRASACTNALRAGVSATTPSATALHHRGSRTASAANDGRRSPPSRSSERARAAGSRTVALLRVERLASSSHAPSATPPPPIRCASRRRHAGDTSSTDLLGEQRAAPPVREAHIKTGVYHSASSSRRSGSATSRGSWPRRTNAFGTGFPRAALPAPRRRHGPHSHARAVFFRRRRRGGLLTSAVFASRPRLLGDGRGGHSSPAGPHRRHGLRLRTLGHVVRQATPASSSSLCSLAYISFGREDLFALTYIFVSRPRSSGPFRSPSRSARFPDDSISASSNDVPVFICRGFCLMTGDPVFGISVHRGHILDDLLDRLLVDHLRQPHALGVLRGNVDLHVVVRILIGSGTTRASRRGTLFLLPLERPSRTVVGTPLVTDLVQIRLFSP